MMMQTEADSPTTRLLKTKMFTEQLVVRRKKDGPPGSWEAPITQSRPLDDAINAWVDQTGNELVAITAPNMFMQWMDPDRTMRLVVAAVMVTYVPAVAVPQPVVSENKDAGPGPQANGWEPVV
jgi:hypothetical protein